MSFSLSLAFGLAACTHQRPCIPWKSCHLQIDGELRAFDQCLRYSGPTGVEISPFVQREIRPLKRLIAFYEGRTVGYINAAGKAIRMYPQDNGPDQFREGLARYLSVDGKKIGVVDSNLNIVIPAKFKYLTPFEGGKAKYCQRCVEVKEGEHTRIESSQWKILKRPN